MANQTKLAIAYAKLSVEQKEAMEIYEAFLTFTAIADMRSQVACELAAEHIEHEMQNEEEPLKKLGAQVAEYLTSQKDMEVMP